MPRLARRGRAADNDPAPTTIDTATATDQSRGPGCGQDSAVACHRAGAR